MADVYPQFPESEEGEVNLRDYLYVINAYKWHILGFTIVATCIAILFIQSIPPVYRATATLLFESEEPKIVKIEEVYSLPNDHSEYLETQLQILQSRELAERVIDKLDIANHPEFDPALKKPGLITRIKNWLYPDQDQEKRVISEADKQNAIVGQFMSQLKVESVRNSQLVKINFDSHDPKLTAEVAMTLANLYIQRGLEQRSNITKHAESGITQRVNELKQKLDDSEKKLQAFIDQQKLVDVRGVDSLAAKELDELTGDLVEAKRSRSEIEELYRQVTALKGQPPEAYESIPSVLKDASVQAAKQLQAAADLKVSELAKRYGSNHPKMIAAKSELETATQKYHQQIMNVVDSVQKEYSIALAKESHLASALNKAKNEVSNINRKQYTLNALKQEVDSNRQLYELFLNRYKETSVTSDLQPANVQIVDKAVVPSGPYKPKKRPLILMSILVSLLISIIVVYIIESLDNTLKDSDSVENKLMLPVLSILPKLNIWFKKDMRNMRYFSNKKRSMFSENIRTIRTSVLFSEIDEPRKVILVTSSIPEEGKSIVSINLAMSLAQMGKTLLIDADMRKPAVARVFGIDTKLGGLSHLIVNPHDFPKYVHKFDKEKLDVLPAGIIPHNPLELLSSKRFSTVMASLKKIYNFIVIDSAPVIPVSDAVVISHHVSSVIYIAKAEETPYQLAQKGIKKLQSAGANIIGVVLNQVSPSKRPGKYGYAESDYYSYYGYGKK